MNVDSCPDIVADLSYWLCPFQEEDNPFWIPERLTRRIQLLDDESQEQDPKMSMDHTCNAGDSGS